MLVQRGSECSIMIRMLFRADMILRRGVVSVCNTFIRIEGVCFLVLACIMGRPCALEVDH